MATTELQAPYTSVEAVERENNGTLTDFEIKEPNSRSSGDKLQSGHLMSNSRTSNHKTKFSNLRNNDNWLRGVEIVVLIIIILVVWVLFAIPTIVYALEDRKEYHSAPQPGQNLCEQPITYNGEVCSSELRFWQQCFAQQTSADIYLPSNIDPEQAKNKAMLFFLGLPRLSPSPECVNDLKPFLCLYLFGSCDSNNQSHQVTQADCEGLRDNVCTQEWAQAERILGRGALPQCGDFPSQDEESCPKSISDVNITTESDSMVISAGNGSKTVCAENYYLNDDGKCMPLCILWVDPPGVGLDADNIAILIGLITAVISAVVLLIISVSVQRKIM